MAMAGGVATTALATAMSCAFGMLSSLSRVQAARGHSAIKALAMNAGAVWLTAFVAAVKLHADLPGAVLIGLGVGLAGTTALEAVERGTLALIARVAGAPVVTHKQLDERLGDERNRTQAALSEGRVVVRDKERPDEPVD
jgi:hypothetical protein